MNPARILVVEDEFIVAKEIEMRIAAMGYQVVESALNAQEALKLTEEHRPNLVLMDIHLQGEMDGITAAEEIRRRFQLPVIFVTAYSEDTTLERAKVAEPYGFILKPFEERELKSAIEIALYKHHAEREILRMNRLYDVLSQVNQAIVRTTSRDNLLETICRITVERGAVNLAWIGWLDPETAGIYPVAHWGSHEELLNRAVFYADDRPEGQGNPGKAIREDKTVLCNECIRGNCLYPAEFAPAQFGFNSCGSFPIHFQGKVCGTLNLGIREAGFFQEREIALLEEVAEDISFALDKLAGDARRVQAEESLRKSEEQYRLLVETSNEGIWAMDREHVTTYVNRAMANMLGYEPSEIIGTKVDEYFFPEDLSFHQERMQQRHAGQDEVYERRFRRRDGSSLWTLVSAKALKDERDRFLGSFAMFIDITERKRSEEALRESEARFRGYFELGQVGMAITSLEKGWVQFNDRLCDILGYSREELSRLTWAELTYPHDLEADVVQFDRVLRGETDAYRMEKRFIRKDGEVIHALISAQCVRRTDGQIDHFVAMVDDITERKHAEQALFENNMQLQEAVLELERAQSMLRLIIESIPVRVFWKDKDLRYLGCNSLFARDAGFDDPQELLGKDDFAIAWREQAKRYRTDDRHIMESGYPRLNIIEPQTTPAGFTIWLSTSKVPLCLPDGEIFGVLGVYEDITDREEAEEALRKSEEKHRSILRAAPIGIGVVVDRVLTEVNDYLCTMTGYSKEELIAKSARILYPTQEHYEEVGREKYRQISKMGTGTVETQWKRKNGVVLDILLSSSPIDPDDHLAGVTFTALDITELKRSVTSLRTSEERHRSIIQAAIDGYTLVDMEGRVLEVNEKYCGMSGYSAEELLSMRIYQLDADHTAEEFVDHSREMMARGEARFEARHRRKDGTVYDVEISIQYRPTDRGQLVAFLRDITERKRVAEEKQKMESQLRHAQKLEAIGNLAGGIAHDFNNILSPIIGYTEMAMDGIEESNSSRYELDQVLTAANRAKDLVRQILSFSRLVEDQLMRPVDMSLIVKEALKLLRASLPSTIEIRQNIHKVTVMADATQIHQVVVNLCTNAAHAMEEDMGILDVSLLEVHLNAQDLVESSLADLTPGKYLKLSVKDTGTGMSSDTMQRIFDPYFTTKEVGKGTGLGLAVAHGIVKRHGGGILVKTELGKGTVFDVLIPAVESKLKRETSGSQILPKGRERILLVDDESPIATMGARILEPLGYKVTAMTSPKEALNLFRSQPEQFDLIITDYTMPQMVGTQLADECRRIRAKMPVIICTGHSERLSKEEPEQIGANAIAMKPVDRKQLAMIVRDVLDKTAS